MSEYAIGIHVNKSEKTIFELDSDLYLNIISKDNLSDMFSLDLSNCPNVRRIYFAHSYLTSLDLSNCSNLELLNCYNSTKLTSINLSNCHELRLLNCQNADLIDINLSDCSNLEHLRCYNPKLANLDISNCKKLKHISSFNVANIKELPNIEDMVVEFFL